MDSPGYNGAPGACAWDPDRDDRGERNAEDQCAHPPHWRRESIGVVMDGECRLCGASATTIAVQRARRLEILNRRFASPSDLENEMERRR